MMYVGASMVHSGDTFRMFDPNSKRIHLTRDVKMLKKMFFRQDGSISSDQHHPLDTTFENLTIVQEEVVTDAVSVNNPAIPIAQDNTSLVSSTSADDNSIDSGDDMPPLTRPSPDDSSTDGDFSDNWSSSTDTTLDATIPGGVLFEPITVMEVDEGRGNRENTLEVPVLDATDLQPGEVLDTTVPVPAEIFIPEQDVSIPRRTRSGRQVIPPSRYRDTSLTVVDGTPTFSTFDVEDEIGGEILDFNDNSDAPEFSPVSLFDPPALVPPLCREVYGLKASPSQILQCENIVRAALQQKDHRKQPLRASQELSLVGATGNAFSNTTDLHVKTLRAALASP